MMLALAAQGATEIGNHDLCFALEFAECGEADG